MPQDKARSQHPRISVDQLKEVIAGSGQRADSLRADGLGALTNVKRAKLVQTRLEYTRLAERHGEDSEPAARLNRQMAVEHGFLVGSRIEHARTQAPSIERKQDVWQVHGHLRNQDGFARMRYTVGLYRDPEGIEAPMITATTNSAGYFHLSWEPPAEHEIRPPPGALPESEPSPDAERESQQSEAELRTAALKHPVFLGARGGGKQALPTMDPRPLYPIAGVIAYRDMIVYNEGETGSQCHFATRLLGNSSTRELHDLDNEKRGCRVAAIRPDHRVYFQSEAQAEKIGYDFCAYCFGKGRSKR